MEFSTHYFYCTNVAMCKNNSL